jgi:hypothetical protein
MGHRGAAYGRSAAACGVQRATCVKRALLALFIALATLGAAGCGGGGGGGPAPSGVPGY